MENTKLFCAIILVAFAAVISGQTSTTNGNWTSGATWVGGVAPSEVIGSGDFVTIAAGDTVTINSAMLEVRNNGVLFVYGYLIVDHADGLEFFNGCTVTIFTGGTIKCTTGEVRNNSTGTTLNGSLICTGDFSAGNGSSISGTGTMITYGTLTVTGSGTVMGSGSGCTGCELTTSGTAYVFYVATTGDDSNSGNDPSAPKLTISSAITATTADGTRIEIADGTYNENDMDIDYSTTFQGTSEAGTIIDNDDVSGQRCFRVTTDGADISIKDMTIRDFKDGGGAALYTYGRDNKVVMENVTVNSCYVSANIYDGAVFIFHDPGASSSDSVVIKNCTFSDNTSAEASGGCALDIRSYSYDYDYSVLLENTTFDNNDVTTSGSSHGACMIDRGYSVTVRKCTFSNNNNYYYGSGLYVSYLGSSSGVSSRFTLENSLFHDNSASNGASCTVYNVQGSVYNSTFAQNTSSNVNDYYVTALEVDGTVTAKNCIFQSDDSGNEVIQGYSGDLTISYSLLNGGSGGDSYTDGGNNSTSDPLFSDAASNDFTLTSVSPAVDAGTSGGPDADILGVTRDGSPDMGCYEYSPNNWTGTTSSAWATSSNWSRGTVPGTSENITIPDVSSGSGNTPIITSDVTLGGLTINSGASLTVSSNSLTVTGTMDINDNLYIDNATVNADGTADFTGGTIDFTNSSGTLILSAAVTSLGTLDAAMGTVEYDGSTQNVLADAYFNLEIDQSGTKTSQGTITAAGNLTVQSSATFALAATTATITGTSNIDGTTSISTGTFNANGSSDIDGTLSINSTGIYDADAAFDATNGNITFTGAGRLQCSNTVTSLGTLNSDNGTVEYDGSSQNVLADAYYNLEIDQSGTKTSQGNITAAGNLTVQSSATFALAATTATITGTSNIDGTTSISTGTFNANGSSDIDGTLSITSTGIYDADAAFDATNGNITFTGAGELKCSSTVTSLGVLTTDNGTVTYDGGTQNVLADTYNNLSISTTGTKTATGNLDVNGNLTTAATASCKLNLSSYDLNQGGNLIVGATDGLDVSDASCSITMNGASDQTITHAGVTAGSSTATLYLTSSGGSYYSEKWLSVTTGVNNTGTTLWAQGNGTIGNGAGLITDQPLTVTKGTTYYVNAFDKYDDSWDGTSWFLHTAVSLGGTQVATLSDPDDAANTDATSGWDETTDELEASTSFTYLTAPSSATFKDFTINKASGNVILDTEISVDGVLTFTSGDIDASSNTLTLTSSATVSGGSDASHVIGTMIKTTESTSQFTFPLGDGTQYKSIAITPSSGNSTVWTAEYFLQANAPLAVTLDPYGSNSGDLDHISSYEYWDLDRGTDGTPSNAKIAIPWVANNAVLAYADLRLAHFDGTDWDMITASPVGTDASGVITSGSAVSTFSPFTLGSSSSTNVLPIELVSFYGEKKDNRNILSWTTASEINNAYFTIEKSYNGFDFEWVGTQDGSSPSTQIINYNLTDFNILKTINYYRLKQTDFDGKFEYSNTISIDNRIDDSFKEIIGRINLLGQEVDEFYNGIVIVRYKDGTSEKFCQFK